MNAPQTPEHYRAAASQLGFHENEQNAALQDYLSTGGQNLNPRETAWCAGFVNASLAQGGHKGTGSLSARSFVNWGQPVETPQVGDVAVFSRPAAGPNAGHVGFYSGQNPDGTIKVLGGNQGDAVSYGSYSPDRLLGYRRPGSAQDGYNIPASAITGDPSAYSGGSIMPVSAIPQGTLMPDAQQQTQQPQGLLGNLDPALGGLIGLSMLAGSFGGGQQGGMGGALSSVIPLLAAAQKKGSEDLKSRREIQYLTSLGYSPKDAALMVHTGQKPTGAAGAVTPMTTYQKQLVDLKRQELKQKNAGGGMTPSQKANLAISKRRLELAEEAAAAKNAPEESDDIKAARDAVQRMRKLAFGSPAEGDVPAQKGAFTGVEGGWSNPFGRVKAGAENLAAQVTQPEGDTVAERYERYKKASLGLLARALGEKGVLSNQDIQRMLNALPGAGAFPDTESMARDMFDELEGALGPAVALPMPAAPAAAASPAATLRYNPETGELEPI